MDRVDGGGTFLCSGEFLNSLIDALNKNQLKTLDDASLIKERGAQGTLLNAELVELSFCKDGNTQKRKFWVASS